MRRIAFVIIVIVIMFLTLACNKVTNSPTLSPTNSQPTNPLTVTASPSGGVSIPVIQVTSTFTGIPQPTIPVANSFYSSDVLTDYTPPPQTLNPDNKTIVVTYSLLGNLVKILVGNQANVAVIVPNGEDIRTYKPSPGDIEMINKADLVVENGLGLEIGLLPALNQARSKGIKFFTASDYVDYHEPEAREYRPYIPIDQSSMIEFPYIWMDWFAMANDIRALRNILNQNLNLNVDKNYYELIGVLVFWDHVVRISLVEVVPPQNRVIITDQEPLQFCRYLSSDYKVVILSLPGLRENPQISAENLATLKKAVTENKTPAVFLKPGIPSAVVETITRETGVRVVQFNASAITYQYWKGAIVERGISNILDIYRGIGNILMQSATPTP